MGSNWKKLSGEGNWCDLLDPLDIDLRRYLIHYGEMAQATRDAFNTEKVSKHAGDCLYKMSNLLSKVEIEQGNPYKYKVTKYVYGTSSIDLPSFLVKSLSREAWSKESNWIGYVAVATEEGKAALGRRDIVVAWRGTVQMLEWINDLKFNKVSAPEIFKGNPNVKIQRGWHSIYTTSDPKSSFNKSCARDQNGNQMYFVWSLESESKKRVAADWRFPIYVATSCAYAVSFSPWLSLFFKFQLASKVVDLV